MPVGYSGEEKSLLAKNQKVFVILTSMYYVICNFTPCIICRYDTRGQSHAEARHWSNEEVLGGRAFFRGDQHPAKLVIDNVKGADAGDYRCRADFYRAPTTISHMRLDVIGTRARAIA